MEKYTFRMEQGGQLKHRPEIGQPPPGVVTGGELADFFLGFLNGSLPLTVKSAPVPQARGAAPGAEKRGAIRGRSGGGGGGGGALELVGSTFRAAVMDESKDVAVSDIRIKIRRGHKSVGIPQLGSRVARLSARQKKQKALAEIGVLL